MNLDTRDPDTLQGVAAEYMDALGRVQCQAVIGKDWSAVYKTSQDNDEIRLKLEDFLALDEAMAAAGVEPPFQRYVTRRNARATNAGDGIDKALDEAALEIGHGIGLLHGAVLEVRRHDSPGGSAITHREKCRLKQMSRRLRNQLDELDEAIDAEHRNGCAPHEPGAAVEHVKFGRERDGEGAA